MVTGTKIACAHICMVTDLVVVGTVLLLWSAAYFPLPAVRAPHVHAARRTRHASENLNFRDAVVRYRALCFEDRKKKHSPRTPRTKAAASVSASATTTETAAGASPLWGGSGGGGGDGGSDDVTASATAAAARDQIVDSFVKEGAPEQVGVTEVGLKVGFEGEKGASRP